MKNFLTNVWNWLVLSSADENKMSATIKGSIWFAIISAGASLLHINGLSDVADHGVSFIVEVIRAITGAYALWGAFRKVSRTVGGNNAVLNSNI